MPSILVSVGHWWVVVDDIDVENGTWSSSWGWWVVVSGKVRFVS